MPPTGFPEWLWAVLSIVLPLVYQAILRPLPGWLKFICSWALSVVVVAIVGIVFLHFTSVGQFLAAFAWLVAAMQAVYSLIVKPIAHKVRRR